MATIQLKRSNTTGANPTTSNLALGELGINTKDGKFFLRKHVDGNTSGDTILTYAPQGINRFGTQTYVTKVISKTAAHPYNGSGSSAGYTIDGLEAPYLLLIPGNTYKFDQADSSNSGHPLRFYLEADKTTAYTTGVTTNGTPGSSGAFTQIVVATTTPQVLYYQCSNHGFMGSASYSVSDAIADGKVGTAQIATNAVTSAKIAQNSILTKHIDDNQITADQIADATVTTTQIAANTIATGNIADNAVDGTKIAQNSILTRHIDDNQVTADQIADATVTTTQIAANTIATGNVADNAIDGTKIASNSILTRHIDDNQIGIDQLNVSDGSNGQVLKTDGSGTLSFGTVSGGGSASNSFETIAISGQSNVVADSSTDTLTLVGGTGITLTTNASSDTITITGTTGISANAVNATHIATGVVGPSELAATAVTAGSYTNTDITVDADGRITSASSGTVTVSDGAITTAKLADDAVTAAKLANTAVSAGTYGSTTVSPQITVDAQGRITNVSNQTISGGGGGSGGIGLNQTVSVFEGTGNGSTTAFNTGTTINSEALTWVFIDGVYQEKGAYSTSGSTVTFSAAPPNGTSIEVNNLSNVTTGGAFNHNSYNGDGSTTAFTLSKTPGSDTDLIVFIDGVYQNADAFNVSGTTLTFDTAPANSTKVIAYTIGGVVMGKASTVDTFNGNASTTAFTLSLDPIKEENTQVYVGGVYQPKGTYAVSGTTLTFSEAPPSGTGNIEVVLNQITTLTDVGANAVTATSIAANAVGSAEIAANSVDSSEIATGSIDTIHIGDDQVTNAKLAVNSVSAVELAGNSVTSTQIAANQVAASEIATGSVGSIHIATGAVATADIADNAVTLDKMAGLARGKIIYGDSSGDPAALAIGSNGTVLKSDGTDASWGTIATANIADDAVTSAKIADDAIGTAQLADDAVTTAGLLEGAAGPLIKSISGTLAPSTAGNITITGAGFSSSNVFVDTATTTALTAATSVTNTSSTSLTAAIPALSAGQYKVFVVNSDGKSAMFPQGILVSTAPTWSTSAGALAGTIAGTSYSATVAASSDSTITYSVASGALPSGISLNTSTGAITGTAPSDASSTTYNFTLRATDAESQTADRAFSIYNLAVTKAFVFTGGSLPSGITHSRTESDASRAHYINSSGYVKPVSTAGDERFTHLWNGSAAVDQGILLEEKRGNYMWSSDVPSIGTWNGGGVSATYSTEATTLPTGVSGNALKIVSGAANNAYTYKYHTKWSGSLDGTHAGWYTWSFYAKKTNSGNAGLRIRNYDGTSYFQGSSFNFTTGAVAVNYAGNAVMEELPGGWYRCSVSGYSAYGLGLYVTFEVGQEGISAQTPGTHTDTTFYVWGMQFEDGRGATSYIVNNSNYASGLTNINYRESDYLRVAGTDWSNVITADSGRTYSAVLSGRMPTRETNAHVLNFTGSGSAYNGMIVKTNSSNSPSDTPYWNAYSTEGLNADVGSFTANADFKIAFVQSVTAGGTLGCRNGGSVGSSGTTYVTPDQMTLGQYDNASGNFGMNGSIKYVYLFNADIGTSTMQSLTS